MRISDWSSDVCSSDLFGMRAAESGAAVEQGVCRGAQVVPLIDRLFAFCGRAKLVAPQAVMARLACVAGCGTQQAGPATLRKHENHDRSRDRYDTEKSGYVSVDLGGRRSNKKKNQKQ